MSTRAIALADTMTTPPATQEYTLATVKWRSKVNVVIELPSGKPIAHFPWEFLRNSGDCSWSYIQAVLNDLIELDGFGTSIAQPGTTNGIDYSMPPEPGVYELRIHGGLSFSISTRLINAIQVWKGRLHFGSDRAHS